MHPTEKANGSLSKPKCRSTVPKHCLLGSFSVRALVCRQTKQQHNTHPSEKTNGSQSKPKCRSTVPKHCLLGSFSVRALDSGQIKQQQNTHTEKLKKNTQPTMRFDVLLPWPIHPQRLSLYQSISRSDKWWAQMTGTSSALRGIISSAILSSITMYIADCPKLCSSTDRESSSAAV